MPSIPTFALSLSMETSIDAMTPYRGDHPLLMDEDSGRGMKKTRCPKIQARRSLMFDKETRLASSKKRTVEGRDDEGIAHTNKRHRRNDTAYDHAMLDGLAAPAQSPMSSIIRAVSRMSTDAAIDDDLSRDCCLPIIPGEHKDLNCVSPDTVRDVLSGCYSDVDEVTIIDCRYPYEYEEGHIQSAINLYTKDAISQFLSQTQLPPGKRHVIIFHCEFSSKRGPKMYRFLRNEDRRVNADRYPRLNFPAVYLLDCGYKAFFQSHQTLCYPQAYTPMLHKEHKDDLRHFRVKSKSWAAGEKPAYRSRVTGVRLSF